MLQLSHLRGDTMRKPKIKITLVDRIGKCGCHRGHKIGDVLRCRLYRKVSQKKYSPVLDTTVSRHGTSKCTYAIEPPCTERYARWCERSATQLMGSLLLYYSISRSFLCFAYQDSEQAERFASQRTLSVYRLFWQGGFANHRRSRCGTKFGVCPGTGIRGD